MTDEIEAIPDKIGRWRLNTATENKLGYLLRSKSYDHRWGVGGCIYQARLYYNDFGANADGKYHVRAQKAVGFENPTQVKQHALDEGENLTGIRGHSVQNNEGDYGMSTGVVSKQDTVEEGVKKLVMHLQASHTPVIEGILIEPNSGWEKQKMCADSARLAIQSPAGIGKDSFRISISNTLSRNGASMVLYGIDEDEVLAERTRYKLSSLDSLPEAAYTHNDGQLRFPTVTAAIDATNEILDTATTELNLTPC